MADKQPKLLELYEADRETVTENLSHDRSPEAAVSTMQKALDRVLYRYSEQCSDNALRAQAQSVLQSMKNTLPLLLAVNDSRRWELKDGAAAKRTPPIVGIILAALGAVLVLIGALFADYAGDQTISLSTLLLPLIGAGCLLAGSILIVKKSNLPSARRGESRVEYLIEPARVYQTVRGALLAADKALSDTREQAEAERERSAERGVSPLAGDETELFASLLEATYARRGAADSDAEELLSNIRYYLHRRGVELEDYTKEHESWFELLPARKSGTLRPAMVAGGKLVKKGMASAKGMD